MIEKINEVLTNDVLEKSVLSCLINRPDCYYETPILDDYFINSTNKAIFKQIKHLIITNKTVDTSILIWSMGADKSEYILELSVYKRDTHWYSDYVEKLQDHYKIRKLKLLWSSIDMIWLDNLWDSLQKIYQDVWFLINNTIQDKSIEESISSVLENAGKREARIWWFGYPEIDARTFGMKPWKFTIIMARPSVGKTLTAVNIMSNLMDQWVKSMILSGEMLMDEITQRFLSIRYWIWPYIFESKSWIEVMDMIGKSWVDDFSYIPEYIRISDKPLIDYIIYQTIYSSYHRDGVRVFILDYIQIASWSWKYQNKATEIGEISGRIKRICNELKIHIISLAQISREWAKSWKMSLEYLKDSWNLEQDADIVIWLDKEEDFNGNMQAIEMTLLKNRWWWWLGTFRYKTELWKITNKIAK